MSISHFEFPVGTTTTFPIEFGRGCQTKQGSQGAFEAFSLNQKQFRIEAFRKQICGNADHSSIGRDIAYSAFPLVWPTLLFGCHSFKWIVKFG